MAARRRREEEHEEHENHERWLVTYADMITLLMVLFIVLYSIGQTDLKKFEALRTSLNNSFGGGKPSPIEGSNGVLNGAGPSPIAGGPIVEPAETEAEKALVEKRQRAEAVLVEEGQLQQAQEQIAQALGQAGLGDAVRFRREGRGLVVTVVNDRILFDSGSAALRPEGRVVLDGLAGPLAKLPNGIAVEGHTDDRPVRGSFGSNWELSTARATSVLRYLLEVHRLPGGRLSAAGYADQRPVAPNADDVRRAENRRVEVVVLSQLVPSGASPASPATPATPAAAPAPAAAAPTDPH